MHPSQQQPDFGILPAKSGMLSPAPSHLRGGGQSQPSPDTPMDDVSYQSGRDDSPAKEVRSLNFGFLKARSKTTKDGIPAKKRGPKRDAKPAISRRQELNRQAQRTHRERKEYYTKSLEMEVARMRETFTHVVGEKQRYQRRAQRAEQQLKDAGIEAMRHENERLKQLLQVNGITYDRLLPAVGSLPTPTKSESHAFVDNQTSAHNTQQASPPNQQNSSTGRQHSFNGQQSPFTSTPVNFHPAIRQQPGAAPTTSTPALHRALSNESATASPIALTPSHTSSMGGYNDFSKPASISGSTYPSNLPSPLASAHQPPHSHGACSNGLPHPHQTPTTIDTVISDTSPFRPPVGQGLVDGRVICNNSDERIEQRDINHDQLGVEFVLALEENCRDHQQFLNLRANPPAGEDVNYELSGHAMMLTNPPPSHIATSPGTPYHQPPNIPLNNLMQLLETAQRLPLTGGEITPVLALRLIRQDERYGLLTKRQFEMVTEKLRNSSRCYGFGAVLEEFEVRDALDAVFEPHATMNT
ncbi:MAG: hypothetical protein Q9217_003305 [Psora testacea]